MKMKFLAPPLALGFLLIGLCFADAAELASSFPSPGPYAPTAQMRQAVIVNFT
jgi:hypothetical protein